MSSLVKSLKPFVPAQGCVASEALLDSGTGVRSDFGGLVKYFEAHLMGDTDVTEPKDFIAAEQRFDLKEGLGKLAWQCAQCKSQGNECEIKEA